MRAKARLTFDTRFEMNGMVKALLALLHEHPANAAARPLDEPAMRPAPARN